MELPSTRELELEVLVRQRDAQITELIDDITRLRRYVSNQQSLSVTDPITLPPPILSILAPHLRNTAKESTSGSSTVINALIQKSRLLQEENDELYEILKIQETGRLKEEVHGLRRAVQRLESGLRESHHVITALSTELDKTHEALLASSKHVGSAPPPDTRHASMSPRNAFRDPIFNHLSNVGNGSLRPPPTGPRAFKKPRLSDSHSQSSPPPARPPPSASHRQHGVPSNLTNNVNTVNRPATGGSTGDQLHSRETQRHGSTSNSNDRDRDRARDPGLGLPSKPAPPPSRATMDTKMDVDVEKREKRSRPPGDRDRQRGDGASSGGADNLGARDGHDKDRASRDRDRGSGKDRGRERGGGSGRERDRERERSDNIAAKSSQGSGSRRNGGTHSTRGGGGTSQPRRSNIDPSRASVDRTLAERMGL